MAIEAPHIHRTEAGRINDSDMNRICDNLRNKGATFNYEYSPYNLVLEDEWYDILEFCQQFDRGVKEPLEDNTTRWDNFNAIENCAMTYPMASGEQDYVEYPSSNLYPTKEAD